MTDLIDVVQDQEIDDAIVELFEFTLPSTTVVYLFKGLQSGLNSVFFPTKDGSALNEYVAIPLELKGISVSSSGAANRPTLSIANIPSLTRSIESNETTLQDIAREETELVLSDEGIYKNEDFLGTRVVYRCTLESHLKESGDAASLPIEFPSQTYIIDRVASENSLIVDFELANVFDLEGVTLPFRQINGRYCPWEYQGHHKNKNGGCTWPLDSRDRFYDKNDNLITAPLAYDSESSYAAGNKVLTEENGHKIIWEAVRTVPVGKSPLIHPSYWKRLDVCGKLISSCKVRFQNGDTTKELPFGGFPGTRTFK